MRLDEISILPGKQIEANTLKTMQKYKILISTDGFDIIVDFVLDDGKTQRSINCGNNASINDAIEKVIKYVNSNKK